MSLESVMLGHFNSVVLEEMSKKKYLALRQKEQEFESIFGQPLYRFCNHKQGFDCNKFWDTYCPHIWVTDGISFRDWAKKHYGERGAELISELIGIY